MRVFRSDNTRLEERQHPPVNPPVTSDCGLLLLICRDCGRRWRLHPVQPEFIWTVVSPAGIHNPNSFIMAATRKAWRLRCEGRVALRCEGLFFRKAWRLRHAFRPLHPRIARRRSGVGLQCCNIARSRPPMPRWAFGHDCGLRLRSDNTRLWWGSNKLITCRPMRHSHALPWPHCPHCPHCAHAWLWSLHALRWSLRGWHPTPGCETCWRGFE